MLMQSKAATTAVLDRSVSTTPTLVIDLDRVEASYDALLDALPGVTVHYAMKCQPDRPVLTRLAGRGCKFEIASAGELEQLGQLNIDPADVLFSNPVKPVQHVAAAHAAGVWRFAVDSAPEVIKIAQNAPGSAVYVRLAVPSASGVASEGKFGVDVETAHLLMRQAVVSGLQPYGIAFHVGSQQCDPSAWATAIQTAADVMRRLERDGIRVSMLDLGGGFPVRYDEPVPAIEQIAAVVQAAVRDLPYPVALVAEPGRYLVAEAGVLVAEVIGTASRAGTPWVHLDVGAFNGVMEALETRNRLMFPVRDSVDAPVRQRCHLTGPTCDSQDTLLYDVELSAGLGAGDRVYLGCAGAYTTAYASTFNAIPIPTITYL
jgi:ornithine decarboxylase